jgi:hypothetical protein
MTAAEIRKRNTATNSSDVDTVAEVNIVTTDEIAIADADEPKVKAALVRWVKGKQLHNKCSTDGNVTYSSNFQFCFSVQSLFIHFLSTETFYNDLFFSFWKHLDDRGFGTPQPFICWLLIPFTLSMIVWYYSVIELMDMADWESKMGPAHEYIPEEPFTWGEL